MKIDFSWSGRGATISIPFIEILAEKVQAKHKKAIVTSDIPDPEDPTDTSKTVSATPLDKVYEHGFYPLQDGFLASLGQEFELFNQWDRNPSYGSNGGSRSELRSEDGSANLEAESLQE